MPGPHHRLALALRRIYYRTVRPLTVGVRALVLEGDKALFVRHTYMEGWYFPGGGVEKEETLEEALRRELMEEVGLTFAGAPALMGAYSNFRDFKSDHVLFFRVPDWRMTPNPNAEIAEQGFFPLEAPPPGTSPGTLRRLAEITGKAPLSPRW
jgi:ADP-ribose pyrophosphatase YjhB (NUDIX family)